ncbi:hypothetical protein LTR09_011427 [Extremus antarcticus]|uniref:Uncharacterized protein n=1 Tax=Extremus antarcticus TaxID=702011 RepID=A0AAJ0DC21_9PEZI|nr:hypothetical protein LTR09_011427 [Extremus antarcticus]
MDLRQAKSVTMSDKVSTYQLGERAISRDSNGRPILRDRAQEDSGPPTHPGSLASTIRLALRHAEDVAKLLPQLDSVYDGVLDDRDRQLRRTYSLQLALTQAQSTFAQEQQDFRAMTTETDSGVGDISRQLEHFRRLNDSLRTDRDNQATAQEKYRSTLIEKELEITALTMEAERLRGWIDSLEAAQKEDSDAFYRKFRELSKELADQRIECDRLAAQASQQLRYPLHRANGSSSYY